MPIWLKSVVFVCAAILTNAAMTYSKASLSDILKPGSTLQSCTYFRPCVLVQKVAKSVISFWPIPCRDCHEVPKTILFAWITDLLTQLHGKTLPEGKIVVFKWRMILQHCGHGVMQKFGNCRWLSSSPTERESIQKYSNPRKVKMSAAVAIKYLYY